MSSSVSSFPTWENSEIGVFSFGLAFFSFSPSWRCFCCYNILKHLIHLPFLSWAPGHWAKSSINLFWKNSIYLFLDSAEMDPCVTQLITSSKDNPVMPLNFFLGHTFSSMNYLILTSFAVWIHQEPPKSSSAGSILLSNLSLFLSYFTIIYKKKSGPTLNSMLGNLSS